MKFEFLKHNIMVEEQAIELTAEVILDQLHELGCIYEDTDHYPTLPYSVEELADVLDLGDISEADDSIIDTLEEIVIYARTYREEVLRWTDLQEQWSDNFN